MAIKNFFENKYVKTALFFLLPVLEFFVCQYAMTDDFDKLSPLLVVVNVIFGELLTLLLCFITGSAKVSSRISVVFFWLIGVVNAYVYRFRGTYIRPWDLFSLRTALNVADNFDYSPGRNIIISTCAAVILFLLAGFLKSEEGHEKKKVPVCVIGALSSLLLIFVLSFALRQDRVIDGLGIYTTQFDSKGMIRNNGVPVTFMYQMKYLKVEKPEGYSDKEAKEVLSSYSPEKSKTDEYPDILVFMDEAFSDPAVDGDFSTNIDYMPFIHSLEKGAENTVTGYVNVSVNGGNTPNSEFEFLTGNTMGFLPEGSIAFQQYVLRNMESLPAYLKRFGYSTLASHPYRASGWDRPRVWKLLGFDELLFDDYFDQKNPERVRRYVSDESCFDIVGDRVLELGDDDPVFSFNVTMQNHSGYKGDQSDMDQSVSVECDGEKSAGEKQMDTYLSLMKYTDSAFEKLIDRYRDSERKTIIVFFGDHQPDPAVFDLMWNQNGVDRESISGEKYAHLFRVPFVIWANFDIDEASGVETSLNYLGNMVLKQAGIRLSEYRCFLDEYSGKYPVISAIRYVDSDGNSVMKEDWGDSLQEYRKLQYYKMFDDDTYEKKKYDFSYDWIKQGNIAHALGAAPDGTLMTNSKEAFIHNYNKGFRIFEADLMYTADDVLMCGHRWDDVLGEELYEERGAQSSTAEMTWEELKEYGIQGRFTPLNVKDLLELMKEYPDSYIVLDMKRTEPESIEEIYSDLYENALSADPEVLDRIIPQLYNDSTLDMLMEIYPFKSCLYSCYKTKAEKFPEYVAGYAKEKGIKVITVDHNKESEEWNSYLKKNGMWIYYNTVNDGAEEDELKKRGVHGIYTDLLAE